METLEGSSEDKQKDVQTIDQEIAPSEITYSEVQFKASGVQKKKDQDHDREVIYSDIRLSKKDDSSDTLQVESNDCFGDQISINGPNDVCGEQTSTNGPNECPGKLYSSSDPNDSPGKLNTSSSPNGCSGLQASASGCSDCFGDEISLNGPSPSDCSVKENSTSGLCEDFGHQTTKRVSWQLTGLLFLLCVLLLQAVVMTVLYVLMEHAHTDLKQQHENTTFLNKALEIKLLETNQKLQVQEERNANLSKEVDLQKCLVRMCGRENFQGKWYIFSKDEKNWNESRSDCQARGGDLIIIDAVKKKFLDQHVGGYGWWVGASDAVEEGRWLWVDNTSLPIKSSLWARNQPDNYTDSAWGGDPVHGEDCGEWLTDSLNDSKCDNKRWHICEVQCDTLPGNTGMSANGFENTSTQSSDEATYCQLPVDEMGLQKLKLILLAILCVILGAFLMAFKVQWLSDQQADP
ncbi:C-type lectin domain family 17, member A-like [Engraulis encrasicolus]|uniref:C-type lectin domain family 17, member A-like n=1 Tax=Engraulis encrasicolus TaxID=184585 RepID=UPI002FCFC2B9